MRTVFDIMRQLGRLHLEGRDWDHIPPPESFDEWHELECRFQHLLRNKRRRHIRPPQRIHGNILHGM